VSGFKVVSTGSDVTGFAAVFASDFIGATGCETPVGASLTSSA
jgi:hypothetical protein